MDLRQEARQILQENTVVDAHLDLLKDVLKQRSLGKTRVIETEYLPDFRKGGIDVVVSSLYVDEEYLPELALRHALDQISCLYQEMEESPDIMALCRNTGEISRAVENGKIAILLSFEGVEPLGRDYNLLEIFYQLGLRLIGLTWSRMNFAANGSRFFQEKRGKEGGLTEFGLQILDFAHRKRMLMDVSHLNDPGFWEVLDFFPGPVIAFHCNCRSLTDIPRNLSDDMIKAIAQRGGVVGINAASIVAAETDENIGLHTLADHIDHIAGLVGPDSVGFGFDLCKRIYSGYTSLNTEKLGRTPFDILQDYGDVEELVRILLSRGYRREDLLKICGGNFLRVFASSLD